MIKGITLKIKKHGQPGTHQSLPIIRAGLDLAVLPLSAALVQVSIRRILSASGTCSYTPTASSSQHATIRISK